MIGISNLGGRYIFSTIFAPTISAFIIREYLQFVRITSSFDLKLIEKFIEEIRQRKLSCIITIWHREIYLFVVLKMLSDIKTFVAVDHLADYEKKLCISLGLSMVPMSHVGSIIDAIRLISKPGTLFVVAVDGPLGPSSVAKPGAAMFSSFAGVPIIPAHICVRHACEGATWDKRIYPLPFNHFRVMIDTPLQVNPMATRNEIYRAMQRYQDALDELVLRQ